jgi:hypothetical protein
MSSHKIKGPDTGKAVKSAYGKRELVDPVLQKNEACRGKSIGRWQFPLVGSRPQ